MAWTWYRDNLAHRYPWLRWGGAWQPDGAVPEPADRAWARQTALVQASAGILPIYWTDLGEAQTAVCGLDTVDLLYRCVPLPAAHRG
jgi:hypothetical protein